MIKKFKIVMGNNCSTRSRSFSEVSNKKPANNNNILSIGASFQFFDLKKDGVIDREELASYFKSDKEVNGILERLDKNKDGVISYNEFYGEVCKIDDGDATLQKYLERFPITTEAIVAQPTGKVIRLCGLDVPITYSDNITDQVAELVLHAGPFVDWMKQINEIKNIDLAKPELIVEKVHIQHVDLFGTKIGFIKFEVVARKWNEKMKQVALVPGIVFMRGGAVGILCVLIDTDSGEEFSLITLQPRIPAGYSDFPEIPAGMLDGELDKRKFAGKAAKEMNEETLLEMKKTELFDLTELAYGDRYRGMYPSAGGCDEFLKLFLYRRYMTRATLDLLRQAYGGEGASEVIKLKVVPLEDLWREAPDAKALSALYLYHKFQELKVNHPITPVNHEQERKLAELIQPKIQKQAEYQQQQQQQQEEQQQQQQQQQQDNGQSSNSRQDSQAPLIDVKDHTKKTSDK